MVIFHSYVSLPEGMLADVGERSACQFGGSTTLQRHQPLGNGTTKKSLAVWTSFSNLENKIHLTNPQIPKLGTPINSQWTPHLPTLVDGFNPFIPSYFACRRHDRIGFRETSLAQKIRSGHQCVDCFTMYPSWREHKRITYYQYQYILIITSIYLYIYIYRDLQR